MDVIFTRLNTCDLAGTGVTRDLPPDFHEHGEDLATCYDWTNLWYDAVWTGRRVVLITPSLFNLEPLLTGGGLRLDGVPVRPAKIVRRLNHDVVYLNARKKPQEISVEIDDQRRATGVSDRSDAEFFRGLNTVHLIQKNNDLVWIRDFLTYHRQVHGLEAVLCYDNGSTEYSLDALADTMAEAGMKRAMIVSAPLPFGARGRTPSGAISWRAMTFHFAVLNLSQFRFVSQARAVLQCDIDEFVWCRNGRSIFDMTRRHPLGFVHFGLEWRYAKTDAGQCPRHSDHVWRRQATDICAPKYCIRPHGPLSWATWSVHQLVSLGRRPFQLSRRAGAWHFRQITTAWKGYQDRSELPTDLVSDPAISDALAGVNFEEIDQNNPVNVISDARD